ncbi:MAG TPA: DUF1801 domain-containing protein [Vicinamibacterales bacterium]|nr:DUF1801 domain-containing protein [Vicinamibacterales bacterium]
MAQNKTIPTAVSPSAFIDQLSDEQRRKDCKALVALMREATGHPPKMWGTAIVGFDQYRYKYASGREGDSMITGFSPRKQELVLYLGENIQNSALMAKLGKHKIGQGCLYIKRLDDVDRTVLKKLIEESIAVIRKQHGG